MALSTEFKKAMGNDLAVQEIVDRRTRARMAQIDAMPKDMRECVYDYGFHVVNTLIQSGIKKPRVVRHVVETILNEFSPTRGSTSAQGRRADVFSEMHRTPPLSSKDQLPTKGE